MYRINNKFQQMKKQVFFQNWEKLYLVHFLVILMIKTKHNNKVYKIIKAKAINKDIAMKKDIQ